MSWSSFIAGFLTGIGIAGAMALTSALSGVIDDGVTDTYQSAALDDLRTESDVLRAMAEPAWLGLAATEAQAQLAALGVFGFAKGSDGLSAGPVYLKLTNGHVTEIQTYCARQSTSGCMADGVN